MESRSISTLPSIYLPAEIVSKKLQKEREKLAFALLVLNNSSSAIQSLSEKKMKNLDGLAGDFGCQLQALNHFFLAQSESLKKEMESLNPKLEDLTAKAKEIQRRLTKPQTRSEIIALLNEMETIAISNAMSYIFRTRLLTVTKLYYQKEDGYTYDRTEKGLISKIVGGKLGSDIGPIGSQIVDIAQSCLSYQSVALLREQVPLIKILSGKKLGRIQRMLEDQNLCKVEGPRPGIPKYFSCTFSNYKAILLRIREEQIPILIKHRTREDEKEKESIQLLFISRHSGEDLVQISQEEIQEKNGLLIVCEAKINCLTQFTNLIETLGFYKLMLICGALENPFHPKKSNLSQVNCEKTISEVEKYRKLGAEFNLDKEGSPFQLYHLYCSSTDEELTKPGGRS